MKKIIFNLFVFLLFCSCQNKQNTVFVGKIIKPTNDEIQLLKDEELIDKISINDDGTFKTYVNLKKDGLYNFFLQPEFQYLIINKGDSLVLRLNSLDFDESLVFTGKGSEKNNYLINLFLQSEMEDSFIREKYFSKKLVFRSTIDSLINIKRKELSVFKSNVKINKTTELILENAMILPLLTHIEKYILRNKKLHNDNIIYFANYRNNINYNIDDLSHFKPYLDYITIKSINQSFGINEGFDYSLNFNLNRLKFIENNVFNTTIKNKLLRFIAYEYLLEEKLLINIDSFIHEFEKISSNTKTNNEIKELYTNIVALQVGKKIPSISLIERNGNIKEIGSIKNSKNIFTFWSYDQNAHQVNLFNKIQLYSKDNLDYNFYLININKDFDKWKFNIINQFPQQNIKNYKTMNFENMSKKMVLNNLNKVIITKDGIIEEIVNFTDLELFLKNN